MGGSTRSLVSQSVTTTVLYFLLSLSLSLPSSRSNSFSGLKIVRWSSLPPLSPCSTFPSPSALLAVSSRLLLLLLLLLLRASAFFLSLSSRPFAQRPTTV